MRSISAVKGAVQPVPVTRRAVFRGAVILLALYVIGFLLAGVSTQRAADSLADTDISTALGGGEVGLTKLEDKLDVFNRRFRTLKVWAFPARQAARVVGIIPVIEKQRQASELLLERIDHDYEAAVAALELGRSIFELQDTTLGGGISISDTDGLSSLRESLTELEVDSLGVLDHLERASRSRVRFEALGANGFFVSLGKRMDGQEARLDQIAEFSRLLSVVLLGDLDLISRVGSSFDEVRAFQSGDVSIGELGDLIDDLTVSAKKTRDEAILMFETAPGGVADSEYGELIQTLRDMNVALYGLLYGIDTILDVMGSSIESLSSSAGGLFEDGHAITETFLTLIESEDELSDAVQLVNESVTALLAIGDSGPISLGTLGETLEDRTKPLVNMSNIFAGAPRIAAEVFGIDGETRRYLMLGQTSDEIRAAGGFTSSAWLLTFRSGALIDNEYLDVTLLEDPNSPNEYPDAFDELQLHMDAGLLYMRDVGWSPHFPSVGKLAADMYEIGHNIRVDGVISLTQWALIDLATALVGLETESGFVSPSELLSVIERETDAQGTGYLASLFDSLLDSLSGGKIQSHGIDLLTTIEASFDKKDLMIYSENREVQRLISKIGWDGGLPDSPRDRLVIVDSNVGWNKVDRNIIRAFKYELDFTELTEPRATLNLSYTNSSSTGETCDLQSHISRDYAGFLESCYWNYLRVYIPNGAILTGGDKLPLETGSIAHRIGGVPAGSRTVRQLYDDEGDYFSGLLTVEPRASKNVTLSYALPSQIIRIEGGVIEYVLDVVAQAGARGRTGLVTIKLPAGYELVEVEPVASSVSNDLIVINLDPVHDQSIRLLFRESTSPGN